MEFLDDNQINPKSQTTLKKESSTIALARKMGINIEKIVNKSSNSKEVINISPLEEVDLLYSSNQAKKPKKDDNGYLVSSEDIDKYLNINKSHISPKKIDSSSEAIDTKDYIIDNSNKSSNFTPFEFKGDAKEYFKIWIVNIALTILTLGIYSAWAKVRNNRYFYGNTYLNGSNFEYNADPKRILYGRLIVVGFYGLFFLATKVLYSTTLALGILAIFILLLPWLIRQAINFRLKSASYRNIHFQYNGEVKSFYKLAIGALLSFSIIFIPALLITSFHANKELSNLLGILTIVMTILFVTIALPIIYLKFKDLIINNSAYGLARFNFDAKKSEVIALFLRISLVTFIFSALLALVSALGAGVFSSIFSSLHIDATNPIALLLLYFGVAIVYLASIGLYKGISDGYLSNFIRNHTKLKDCPLKGEISPIKLGFISMTNSLLILLSLGLLYPWAKIRYLRYKIENSYFKCKDYNQFKSASRERVSTVGEETMDFFDIDIGI